MTNLQLAVDDVSLSLAVSDGGRWAGLRVADLDLIGGVGDAIVEWGNFIMAPFAGRIRHGRLVWQGQEHALPVNFESHAIHGMVFDRPWQVLDHDAGHAVLRCDIDDRWPWRGHVVQRLELTGDRLRAAIEVHADEEPMPAWTGFHPWFHRTLSRGEPARITLDCDHLYPRDDEWMCSLPTVSVPSPLPDQLWDDGFGGVRWPASITWPGALRLDISADHDYAVVFNHRPAAICVEPQTAPPNAVELGLAATVEPGTPLILRTEFAWSPA